MSQIFNIYGDESCHIENDHISVMVLGVVWCPNTITKKIGRDIRKIKVKHGLKSDFEIKWTKVSDSKIDFYLELVDYFFSNQALRFRGLVIPDKSLLDHGKFNQEHNEFYYKMYFYVLKNIIQNNNSYRVYLDIKDTLGREKLDILQRCLYNANYDYNRDAIERIQHIRSHEVEQLQLADLFIGALGYVHRELSSNKGKVAVIEKIRNLSGKSLIKSTLPSEDKFNVFVWEARQ
ncbi:TPA: DUF3800 domain-containing protein [Escherichia coli]|uniref:DUF3800 domain-containing protein n=1 Tax=Shewanella algae TaxID=38313 RepID=UPI002A677481|nr:DUF3800 domain-containing protein [Vibrio fluvialis]HBQ4176382.1 DUF3800 domain-containing protein [Escherichia coli]